MIKTKTSAGEFESVPPLGDMSADDFRRHGHEIVDWIGDYLARVEEYPVLAQIGPGELKAQLPPSAPSRGERMEDILADLDRLVVPRYALEPPGFLCYFSSRSAPASSAIAARLNVNACVGARPPPRPTGEVRSVVARDDGTSP